MAKKYNIDTFNEALGGISSTLLGLVISEVRKKWKLAYLDVRSAPGSTALIHKIRVKLADGSIENSLNTPMDVVMSLLSLWKKKAKLFPEEWYGLKIVILPDGKTETEFNYDPECAGDETFFHD